VKRVLLFAAVAAAAAGCGGSKHAAPPPKPIAAPPFARAFTLTTAERTVKFAQITSITVSGSTVRAYASGNVSFARRLGHVYTIQPGNGVQGETIVIGRFVYENANVQAALNDPSVPPWTKLDTSRLTAKERSSHPDDLAHALAPAYLAGAVSRPRLVRTTSSRAVYVGTVDPAAIGAHVPAAERALVVAAVRGDYPAKAFPARFWLDARGRLRRVRVAYRTPTGTPVSVDTSYDAFGVPVDVTLPRADEVKDIPPR
jgi:hypothetical protein